MANVASQVILHPTASSTLKILGTTVGRDKVYRATQYFARFLRALSRKLLRLGKPLEHLQAALRAAQSAGDLKEQLTTIARQLAYFGYLGYDSVVWANAIKLITLKPETSQKVQKISNRFWLAGILFSLTHGILKVGRLNKETRKIRGPDEKNVGEENARKSQLRTLQTYSSTVIIDILDVWLPAANLGLANLNDGTLGIFGVISSVLALRTQWLAVNAK
ncbi:peroxisomal biogenesis factor 11-domain-containing protein [Russula aff. rugulosa BPL654]|nr:peroxisomal biogenesis factor 11-domain-containing protein [Russula aff. rugulosa BPL654]